MAKSSKRAKSRANASKANTSVTDAVEVEPSEVVDVATPDTDDAPTPQDAPVIEESDVKDDADLSDAQDVPAADVVATDDHPDADQTVVEADQIATSDAPVEDDVPASDNYMPDPQPAAQPASRGFVPLVLGGVVAGAIGYAVAFYTLGTDTADNDNFAAQIAQKAEDLAALQAQMTEPDLSALEAQVSAIAMQSADQISAFSDDITAQLSAIVTRLSEVEKRPNSDGTLSDTALEAYKSELEALRAELDAQQETVMSAAAQAEADLAAARGEAARLEQEAIAQVEAAAARAALNRVATAVETGAPFVDALADLDVSDLPAALMDAAETGVATNAALTADFPDAARAALAKARSEGLSDDAGGLGGFLRSQFDVRSTAPREGSGPDAILSRAEAAVKEGRTADALAELEALPDVAGAELTDWTARATQRAAVLDAIATLSETYK